MVGVPGALLKRDPNFLVEVATSLSLILLTWEPKKERKEDAHISFFKTTIMGAIREINNKVMKCLLCVNTVVAALVVFWGGMWLTPSLETH